jgi:hypothetical protein
MVVKKHKNRSSGTGGLEFKSPHFDQKKKRALAVLFFFFVGVDEENFVLRSRRSSFFKRSRRKACFSAASAEILLPNAVPPHFDQKEKC